MEKIEKIKKEIGENIMRIRFTLRKEVKEVASDLEISQAAYRNIERGLTDISISRIFQLADYFKVHFSQILTIDSKNNFYFSPTNQSTGTQNNHQIAHQQGESNKIFQILNKEMEFLKEQNQNLIRILSIKTD